ncbi:MAG TPA: hypothetical protein VFV75_00665 [Candidatus Polarisedimenticolaceae bacterium]|nr:hypothetical protein [Candidatus Polarisedimenticolaceae bacterium]
MSERQRLLVVAFAERESGTRLISAGAAQPDLSGADMKRKSSSRQVRNSKPADRDTMRPEYDFSEAMRGVSAYHFAKGKNVVALDPELLDVFPDSKSVNNALHALAPLLRQQRLKRLARRS